MGARGVSRVAPIGKRFGRVVVASHSRPEGRSSVVDGRCDCGDVRPYFITNIARQAEPMCPPCREKSRPAKGQSGKHPLFNIWKAMIQRCENPNHTHYASYGGRGVVVCERWRNDFEAFAADMGDRPSPRHTIDRMNNQKGYQPGNVRWATPYQQLNNTRRTVYVEWQGKRITLSDAAEISGVDRATIAWRVNRGWSMEKIMTTPSTMTANKGVPKRRKAA
jgi:hypothetical protein